MIQYLLKEGECANCRQLIEFVAAQAPTYQEEFMTIAQRLEQKGWRAGRQEGRQEGERPKALAIAKNMLAEGIELALIQKVTGLLDKEITALMQKH